MKNQEITGAATETKKSTPEATKNNPENHSWDPLNTPGLFSVSAGASVTSETSIFTQLQTIIARS